MPPDVGAPCRSDGDCSDPGFPACDLGSGRCVRCSPTADRCPRGQYCAPATLACVDGCRGDDDCAASGAGRYCDVGRRACVQCRRDAECAPGRACAAGRCVPACTAATPCASGLACCDGGCVDVRSDELNCGACGAACSLPNASASCRDGRCAVRACNAPYDDCDRVASTGCEVDLGSSVEDCGACGRACPTRPHAVPVCDPSRGGCGFLCEVDFADCNADPADGCEVDLRSSATNCGVCGATCRLLNAAAACVGGACVVAACAPGWGDCDRVASNGCGTDMRSSAADCGACGRSCPAARHAEVSCVEGTCRTACADGFADCDGLPSNGCEVDTHEAPSHCGACGVRCSLPHAAPGCELGACAVGACDPGFSDCDHAASNGCEADLTTSASNCGACGRTCAAGQLCAQGACTRDCGLLALCGDRCSDPRVDDANCGRCGNACPPSETCVAGACTLTCRRPEALCGGRCLATSEDPLNCGGCGNVCPRRPHATAACEGGACGFVCDAGFADCNLDVGDGCETDTRGDAAHCGACGRACRVPWATPACRAGECGVLRCDEGREDCDPVAPNGCETGTQVDVNNCGGCGTPCALPHATPACRAGRCAVAACDPGFADCDGAAANGCETALGTGVNCGACGVACGPGTRCTAGHCASVCPPGATFCAASGACADTGRDLAHCGACEHACPARANAATTCASGACGFVCAPGFLDCDGSAANGCEVDARADPRNCGRCANACAFANAAAACSAGSCALGACAAGFDNCDGAAANGCESDLGAPAHCGFCGRACSLANATAVCAGGRCAVARCDAGFGDCDGAAADGCETSLASDGRNCGGCGRVCGAATRCVGGVCAPLCAAPLTACGGRCVDLGTDPVNCGLCGYACGVGLHCVAGRCALVCGAPLIACGAQCVDPLTDVAHCGACGRACGAGQRCAAGVCTPICAAPLISCGPGCVDPMSDAGNCGACGRACSAGASCLVGACIAPTACPPPPAGLSAHALASYWIENGARVGMGIPCATMVPSINTGAARHCQYYSANRGIAACVGNAHVEVSSCSMYIAANFWDRMAAAGYAGRPAFEDMHFLGNGASATQGLIDSIWHRTPILSPWVRDFGYGNAPGCDTMDFGDGEPTPASVVAVYPFAGQTGVPTSFGGGELPAPPPPPGGWPSGYPVHVYIQGSVNEHVLTRDGSAAPIPHVWLAPGDARALGLLRNEYVMYADTPLAAATRYRVRVVGSNGGGAVTRDWSFTTR